MNHHITKLFTQYFHCYPFSSFLSYQFSGIKIRNTKKSSQSIFTSLSQDYLLKYNEQSKKQLNLSKKQLNSSSNHINQQKNKIKQKTQEDQLLEIQSLKQHWLNSKINHQESYIEQIYIEQDNNKTNNKNNKNNNVNMNNIDPKEQQKINQQIYSTLKIKGFKKQLSKTQLINNSRQFLYVICNIFPKHQVDRITSEIKQFCNKRDLNMPQQSLSLSSDNKNQKKLKKKQQRQQKYIQKITKQRERKLFTNIKRILNENINDLQVIDSVLNFLSCSDPYIMNFQDVQKLVYNHQQGFFQDQSIHHKSGINIVLDKKQRKSLLSQDKNNLNLNANQQQKQQEKQIDQLIQAKKDFFKQTEEILKKNQKKIEKNIGLEQEQQDLVNVFEQFSSDLNKQQSNMKQSQNNKNDKTDKSKRKQKNMKLYVKKNINQKQQIPQRFQITQHSLHQIQRILFKNKKIIQDNVIFKKVKNIKTNPKIQKQRQQFGKNWIYAYEMPYSLTHQTCQQFIDFLSNNYGDIIQYYIFPYKNMLQKRQNLMIYVQNQKKQRIQQRNTLLKQNNININVKQDKQKQIADKLLDKIQKQKSLKLNKSSMVFKFRNYQNKMEFLLPEMRLYGVNFKVFRNVRFEQAQSKKLIALSMISWGCSTDDLLKAINKALKPLDIQVSYQSCILSKGYIFIQFDNFYQSLNACRLLNNLQFQGQQLKVQLNYGSSKIYNKKYKSALEFDHYQTLVNKLKDIKCFYNNIYDDDKVV